MENQVSQNYRRYYLSEFSLYDSDHFITFNIVDINTERQEITVIPMIEHSYGDWQENLAPTCTEKGKERRTCTACVFFEERDIEALDHDYQWTVTDADCEVISKAYTFEKKLISPAMTRFENKLGGRVVVMGMTLECNKSQSLFNYRRQRLIQELIVWCADEYVFVKDAPEVLTVVNESVCPEKSRFGGMLTLKNLCEDAPDLITLHFPLNWQSFTRLSVLDQKGEWQPLSYERTDDGVAIKQALHYLTPMYILGQM